MNSSLLCPLKIAQISRKGVQSFILQPQHPLHFQLQHPLPFPFILLTPASSPASLPSPYPQVAWAPSLVAALALLASPLERLKVLHPSGDIGVNVPSIGACSPPHQQSQPLVGRDLPPGVPHSASSLGTWRECPFHRSLVSPLQFLHCIDYFYPKRAASMRPATVFSVHLVDFPCLLHLFPLCSPKRLSPTHWGIGHFFLRRCLRIHFSLARGVLPLSPDPLIGVLRLLLLSRLYFDPTPFPECEL